MPLTPRYRNDGVATVPLNDLQRRLRDQVETKVRNGTYATESVTCAVCNAAEAEVLAEKDRYGLSLNVVMCRRCGLVYTNPRMTREALAAFYDTEYRELYQGHTAPLSEQFARGWTRAQAAAAILKTQLRSLSAVRIADVGCGAGGMLAYLRQHHACEVFGCDLGSAGVRFGVEHHGLPLVVGDLGSVQLPWRPDVVIYSQSFEHLSDLDRECQFVHDLLEKGGLVYIDVPSIKNIRKAYDWDFLRVLQNAHNYHFTLTSLTNVMRRNAFRLVSANEAAQALFTPVDAPEGFVDDSEAVRTFLVETERWRPVMQWALSVLKGPRRVRSWLKAISRTGARS